MPGTEGSRTYLDHAATSYPKPPGVWEALLEHARDRGAPAGRSGYRAAIEVDRAIDRTRQLLAALFGARAERVIFTLNTTDALNLAIKGLLRPRDHVVTTVLEHNSVTRPLAAMERRRGVGVSRVPASPEGLVEAGAVLAALTSRTRLVVMLHASNVCGTIQPVREIARELRRVGVPLLLDAAQTAGSLPLHLENDDIDMIAVPGHKGLLGPAGTGALILSDRVDPEPLREGGTGLRSEEPTQPAEYPHRLESGTPNIPGIIALGSALDWIHARGLSTLRGHLEELMVRLQAGLDRVHGLTWYGPREIERREPVYSIRVDGYTPTELATVLDTAFGVETRSGLHCAPGAHRAIGTWPDGACRLSLGATSTGADIERALAALEAIAGS